MCFGKIFSIGSFSLKKIRHSIQPKTVNTHLAPKINYFKNLLLHFGVVIIQIGLMVKKTVPVILLGHFIPRPVTGLKILENNSYILVLRRIIRPHIIVSFDGPLGSVSRCLEPLVLIRSVVDDQFGNHFKIAAMCFFQELLEFL